MASSILTILSIIVITLFSSCMTASSASDCGIGVYWGQNGGEGSLRDACDSGLYKYVSIAYLEISRDGYGRYLNLDGHCIGPIITCPLIVGLDVVHCQKKGIKVLLSLSGGVSNKAGEESAKDLAKHIWNRYLGGWDFIRPLGQIRLDGVDIALTSGSSQYYKDFATALKGYSTEKKKVYLSASPGCSDFGDTYTPAISAGAFDYVWVRFYNDSSCDYSGGPLKFAESLVAWSVATLGAKTQLFAGLAASSSAVKSGYIPAEDLVSNGMLVPFFKYSNFGGVMIWNRYFDKDYSKAIAGAVCNSKTSTLISQVV